MKHFLISIFILTLFFPILVYAITINDGDLIRAKGTFGVYLIEKNFKRPIKSAEIFITKGYKWGDVIEVNWSILSAYHLGDDVILSEDVMTEHKMQTITINTPRLRVRSLPGLEGEIITLVLEGDSYNVISEQNGWYQINYKNDKTGWVMGRYIHDTSQLSILKVIPKRFSPEIEQQLSDITKYVIMTPGEPTTKTKTNFHEIIKRNGVTEKNVTDTLDLIATPMAGYMKLFYLDALYSIRAGKVIKSGETTELEEHLIKIGAITQERYRQNQIILEKIANNTPIFTSGEFFLFTEEIILQTIEDLDEKLVRLINLLN